MLKFVEKKNFKQIHTFGDKEVAIFEKETYFTRKKHVYHPDISFQRSENDQICKKIIFQISDIQLPNYFMDWFRRKTKNKQLFRC